MKGLNSVFKARGVINLICPIVLFCACATEPINEVHARNQIFITLSRMEELFTPEDSLIYLYDREWKFYDIKGTSALRQDRLYWNNIRFHRLMKLNPGTPAFTRKLKKRFKEHPDRNLGILLTDHEWGGILIRNLPLKKNIHADLSKDWQGDSKFLSMTDDEFDGFLKSRISFTTGNRAVFRLPYYEVCINFLSFERENYHLAYYFRKNRDGKWLLKNVKIEEDTESINGI